MTRSFLALAALLLVVPAATPAGPAAGSTGQAAAPPPLQLESFALPNGLAVTLHPDHSVPRVVVNTWFGVGSKDEVKGRTGFAHLFEHLMFMGTSRVPGSQFDLIMETGGGANNASTSTDRTNYYSSGPPSLLPTLLWLDADRYQSLGQAMTREKVDLQRAVVRNERRQTDENTPYGLTELAIPESMYPEGHPYHHPVIGSHQDLEAATLEEVVDFFNSQYVPANGSLVVAGDFDPAVVRPLVERLFGAVPARPHAVTVAVPPARLDGEVRRVLVDRVELPRLDLIWHAPPAYAPGTAELDLLALVLADGRSSRLVRRLVLELKLAEAVEASLDDSVLGSLFRVQVRGVPGADLDRVKREVLAVVADLAAAGPTGAELASARTRQELEVLRTRENLGLRADKLNEYRFFLGRPDGFALDLARYAAATTGGLRDAARRLGEGRLDLRTLPRTEPGPLPDTRPADVAAAPFAPPLPATWKLASGLEVRALPRRGSGLFAARLLLPGAATAVPASQAGAAALLAGLITSGAGGRDAGAFAAAVSALGGQVEARVDHGALAVEAQGLARSIDPMLQLVADAVRRPALAPADFARERALLAARVEARAADPERLGPVVMAGELWGQEDPRGRPAEGTSATVAALTIDDVRRLAPTILDPRAAVLLVAGDFDPEALRATMERRFGGWRPAGAPPPAPPAPRSELRQRRIALVDRPGAPQTLILAARPLTALDGAPRAARDLVNVALGGAFTSRLNQNLREKRGYTYGADSTIAQVAGQAWFTVSTSVQTEVTGAALAEICSELGTLTSGGLPGAEASKARETARSGMADALGSSTGLVVLLGDDVLAGRPASALRDRVAALDQATAPMVDAVARSGAFAFDQLTLVLVGDRAAIEPQLEKAGLGAPVLLDVEGHPAAR
jgi:predicted Zn-dependent peptidase